MTFLEYINEALREAFPDGYSSRLRSRYEAWARDALIDLQKCAPELQGKHKEYIPQSATFFSCGASAFDAPPGKVTSFHTELACNRCDRVVAVPYTPMDFRRMLDEQLTACKSGCKDPCGYDYECADYSKLPYGYYDVDGVVFAYPTDLPDGLQFATATIDLPRSSQRAHALYDGRVWTWPVINSDEVGVLQWTGIKRNWKPSDEMPWKDESGEDARDILRLVILSIQWHAKMFDDCDVNGGAVLKSLYENERAFFIVDTRNEEQLPEPKDSYA